MLKVVKGDRPDRPSSGLSDALWDLLVATWVVQYARKPRERPSVSTVLIRLKECVGDWGKSITPLIQDDWENDDSTITASHFNIGLVILLLTGDSNGLARSRTGFVVSQLNRPALVETFK